MPISVVQRATDPSEQRHRERVVQAVIREDVEGLKAALSEINEASVLSSMVFIVERTRNRELLRFVEDRVKLLSEARVESA